MKTLLISIFTLIMMLSQSLMAEDHAHGETGHEQKEQAGHSKHGDHEEGGAVKLTPTQIRQAGLQTAAIKLQPKPETIRAPGSVAFNAYRLSDVTSLVDGLIHARHARLGDKVKKGQKLVTLMSTALAQAQADFLRAEAEHRKSKQEWKRLEGLAAQRIVSQARLQQAESAHQAAHANLAAARAALSAYGLRSKDINALTKRNEYGELLLRAPGGGTVVADDFRIGQHVAAGTLLLQIADEETVWVEVQIPESKLAVVKVGQAASVMFKGSGHHHTGKVVNIHHQLDLKTRTAGVRLEIENREDELHPGMFVNAEIEAGHGEMVLLLPEQAIQRQGSELIVFVEEEPGHFERREVRVGKSMMGLVPVLEGVKEGESVVIKGAFVLASELAKSGFEAHQH
ncbi:MAG: efflux RND transporter periplasmic adaptor subunit [Mariprofundaceae bacterium]